MAEPAPKSTISTPPKFKELSELYAELVGEGKKNVQGFDETVLKKAFDYASHCHQDQKRQSGEPYVTHPIEVATIVAGFKVDMASITAAILHDVVEDTHVTLEDVERDFGKTVADLVDGLTKIAKIEFRSNQERLAENFRKMVIAMAKDLRVIIVKLADRLHNMRTIKALPPAKRIRIAQETMDIYAPLANRLGIYGVKSELEDLCLRQLKPEIYEDLKRKIAAKKGERVKYIDDVKGILLAELYKYGFTNVEVRGRPKHFYSIYKKMQDRSLDFEDIHDLFAFRIIVDSIKDCYEALGVVHAMWKPMPGRFKDYIAMPKANLYQSLHTTVIRPSGEPCEIQIRTLGMHEVCEFGVAAHWSYKEGNTNPPAGGTPGTEKMGWLRQIVEWQKELKDPDEFLESVKVDLFDEEIFVFTPKGDVFQLPVHATALDFAFAVHSAIGQATVGAKVNGRIIPIKKELKSGDIVEILTSPKQRPNKDWLSFATTSKAKNRIRGYLRTEQRDRSKILGRDLLNQEMNSRGLDLDDLERSGQIQAFLKASKEANLDDVFVSIGYGKIAAKDLVERVFPPPKVLKSLSEVEGDQNRATAPLISSKKSDQGRGILVSGLNNLLVAMARCCSPLPGEDIVGFITRGKGVTIHKFDCARARAMDPDRKVEVSWGSGGLDSVDEFLTFLKVVTHDKPGILADVTQVLASLSANIKKAQVQVGKDRLGYIDFEVMIKSASQLQSIISRLEALPAVLRVERRVSGIETKKRKNKK
ncbi:MAG: bifunctional (p)ppGpp synthetase/guanosine-3',5'-bis(diphosphate) 3'-pyrophosphohydrolase [Proteobacteria bacterium]|nr:bifunctional (p)ppGpp synthetase/guanosine-3',5'-bis(diphosphate) 3'-pyrophosphohydrolase [Pseudomonadota bacterium]